MRKILGSVAATAILATAGLFVGAGSVGAQVYPPGGCTIALSLSAAAVGDQVTVSGTNFPAGPVSIFLDGQLVATATAASDFSATFTVPGNAAPGPHTVRAAASDGTCDAQATLNVFEVAGGSAPAPGGAGSARAGSGAAGGALAFTGTSWIVALLLLALLCLTIGAGLLIAAKRRAEVQRRFAA